MIRFFYKILKLNMKNEVVTNKDISKSYDNVSTTYHKWLEQMDVYTKQLIQKHNDDESVLDLCCGTGFISKEIRKENKKVQIEAVDISKDMLDQNDVSNITKLHKDAREYLKETDKFFDSIYIGYALPYIEDNSLYKDIKERLNEDGTLIFITNMKGTLKNSYPFIFKVMKENGKNFNKVFNVKLHSKRYYIKKLRKNGYKIEHSNIINEEVTFKDKEKFVDWLLETGAFAGINELFVDIDLKKEFMKYVDKYFKKEDYFTRDDVYSINHKFLQVIARRDK